MASAFVADSPRGGPVPAIRVLRPADLPGLRALLLGLGPEDRALRFGGATGDAAVEAHCRRLAQADGAAAVLGAFAGGRLIGAVELWFDAGPPPRGCEAAVAVDAAWCGRGVGTGLLDRAALVARNRGARRLRLCCRTENGRMRRLARRLAGGLRFDDEGAGAELVLPGPSWHSLWAEAVADTACLIAAPPPGSWWPGGGFRPRPTG